MMADQRQGADDPQRGDYRPTVSVVVPAYNAEDTIGRALDSVRAQTYDNIIEVIVIDDGSTDRTGETVQSKYPQFRYVHQPNAGAAAARNRAVDLCTGEYIAFLDADDEWLPTKLERQVHVMRRHPQLGALCTDVLTAPEGSPRPDPPSPPVTGSICFVNFRGVWTFEPREALEYPSTWVLRREVLLDTGGFDEDICRFVAHDTEFVLRLLARGYSAARLTEPLAVRYLLAQSLTYGRGRKRQRMETTVRYLRKYEPGSGSPLGDILSPQEFRDRYSRRLLSYTLWAMANGYLDLTERFLEDAQPLTTGLRRAAATAGAWLAASLRRFAGDDVPALRLLSVGKRLVWRIAGKATIGPG